MRYNSLSTRKGWSNTTIYVGIQVWFPSTDSGLVVIVLDYEQVRLYVRTFVQKRKKNKEKKFRTTLIGKERESWEGQIRACTITCY